jgi:hypothetical protein
VSLFSDQVAEMEVEVFTRLGDPAAWSGIEAPVWVILDEEDLETEHGGGDGIVARSVRLSVRGVEVPRPVSGDEAAFAVRSFRVIGQPRLARTGVWLCEAVEI